MSRRRDVTVQRLLLAFTTGLFLACAARVAQGQRPDVIWKETKHDGYTAPKWVHDVVYASASTTGYGAARLVGMKPVHAAATVNAVALSFHLRGWIRGDYRPSKDWAFDAVTRGGPALVLAACESKGRKVCVLALSAFMGAYVVALPWGHP
jgi:hypothetical protein